MGQRTAGDLLFEKYLEQHGLPIAEHEPDLGVSTRPDYVIERDGFRCVCEVKEFARDTMSIPWNARTASMETVLKPFRSQIREAVRNLKPLGADHERDQRRGWHSRRSCGATR